jgi:transmembrane sensor
MMFRQRPPQDPEAAAIWWATRRRMDPAAFAQDGHFKTWLADAENRRVWTREQERDALIGQFASEPGIRRMRQEALAYARAARPPKRRSNARWAVAAGLMLAVASAVVLSPAPGPAPHPASADAVTRYATARGERREVVLDDGSRVALNGATIVQVGYATDRRDIQLLSGQALFHVAKDASRPFVVAAGDRLITATGTAFDVEVAPDGGVKVLLVEGSVEVDPLRRSGLPRLLPLLDREVLRPGQQLSMAVAGSRPVIRAADVEQGTAWNRGLVMLRDDSVASAVAQFNRHSLRRLEIEDDAIGRLLVSGVFRVDRPEDFVAALTALHPVDAVQAKDAVALKLRQQGSVSRQ